MAGARMWELPVKCGPFKDVLGRSTEKTAYFSRLFTRDGSNCRKKGRGAGSGNQENAYNR
jgi:hypothetical protein